MAKMNPICVNDETEPDKDARSDELEAGFQFVLTNDAELLKRLEDA